MTVSSPGDLQLAVTLLNLHARWGRHRTICERTDVARTDKPHSDRKLTSRTHRRTQWSRGLYDDSHVADGGSLSVSVKGDRLPVGADEPQRSRGGSIEFSQGQRQKGGTMRGNFFETLFDFKFEKFLIVRVAQVLYTLVVFGTGLYAVLFALSGLQADQPERLIYAVVGWFLMILVARINLELMLVMFRIFENTEDILLEMQVPDPSEQAPSTPTGPTDAASSGEPSPAT